MLQVLIGCPWVQSSFHTNNPIETLNVRMHKNEISENEFNVNREKKSVLGNVEDDSIYEKNSKQFR